MDTILKILLTDFLNRKIRYNKYKPYELDNLVNLKLSNLEFIPENLYICKNLTCLDLGGNNITTMKNIENITSLKHLILSHNQIEEISGLDKIRLEFLDLRNNKIKKINGLIFQGKLISIHLENNKIRHIENIKFLDSLHELFIYNNPIKRLDENLYIPKLKKVFITFKNLKNLKELDNFNRIKFIDVGVETFT